MVHHPCPDSPCIGLGALKAAFITFFEVSKAFFQFFRLFRVLCALLQVRARNCHAAILYTVIILLQVGIIIRYAVCPCVLRLCRRSFLCFCFLHCLIFLCRVCTPIHIAVVASNSCNCHNFFLLDKIFIVNDGPLSFGAAHAPLW